VATVVTGSAGFIGRHLVASLSAAGHDVVGIDRRPAPPLPGVRMLVTDLAHPSPDVRRALAGAEAVFHLAGRPGVRDSSPTIEVHRHRDNVLTTRAVLTHVPLDVPVVVTSSSSVYGGSSGRACHEDDAVRPAGGYARSKAAAEALCHQRLVAGGVVGIARPFTVVGEGQREDMALARWVAAVADGQPVTVYGGLHRTRDLTDVREVVRGLEAMARRRVCGTVNLGTGVGHPLSDLLREVSRAVGREPVGLRLLATPAGDADATLADPARCRELLGFVPHTDLADVVVRQVAAAGVCVAVPAYS
jgi:nucleoside-diphosphate-sugar epimerase